MSLLKPRTSTAEENESQPTLYNANKPFKAAEVKGASYTAKDATAASYTPSTYQADERQVDSKSTVAGQMEGLLSKDSAYMKRAETKGLQQANKRGILNSDFAVSAAHGAAIDAALPIAQQDASTFNNQSLTNQGYSNDARKTNAAFVNDAGKFNATNQQQTNLVNQEAQNRAQEFNASNQQQADQFNATTAFNSWSQQSQQMHAAVMEQLSSDNKSRLIEVEMDYKKQIENDKNASQAYMQAIQSMGNALGNSALKGEQQQRAVDEITSQLGAFLEFNSLLSGNAVVMPKDTVQTQNNEVSKSTEVQDLKAQLATLKAQLEKQKLVNKQSRSRGGHNADSRNN